MHDGKQPYGLPKPVVTRQRGDKGRPADGVRVGQFVEHPARVVDQAGPPVHVNERAGDDTVGVEATRGDDGMEGLAKGKVWELG